MWAVRGYGWRRIGKKTEDGVRGAWEDGAEAGGWCERCMGRVKANMNSMFIIKKRSYLSLRDKYEQLVHFLFINCLQMDFRKTIDI